MLLSVGSKMKIGIIFDKKKKEKSLICGYLFVGVY